MSRFTVGDMVKQVMNSCYRTASKRSEDTAKKLEIQSKMHESKIRILEKAIRDLDAQKAMHIRSKNIPMAKKAIIERHKVMLRKNRCEQLKDCCDKYLESISEFDIVKDTVGALNEAKTTFRHINIESIGAKVGEIGNVVADFRAELNQTQDALSDMNWTDITDAELKDELDALDALDRDSVPIIPHKDSVPVSDVDSGPTAESHAKDYAVIETHPSPSPAPIVATAYKQSGMFV